MKPWDSASSLMVRYCYAYSLCCSEDLRDLYSQILFDLFFLSRLCWKEDDAGGVTYFLSDVLRSGTFGIAYDDTAAVF